jgi:hypothetical protein
LALLLNTKQGNTMATEFDPVTRRPLTDDPALDPTLRNDPLIEDRGSGMGTIGLLAALAVAAVLGLVFWSMSDQNTTASNTTPGVTTGSSTTPSPSNPPPAKGAGESNSTR